jgi:hypothetical protein
VTKDRRLYGKFTLDFPDHPKIAILSDSAFRCLVEATLWSRKQQTDGVLARRYAVATWSLDVLHELCANDDENPSLIEHEKGWIIHDYAEHQDTKADIEARQERNRIAGQKGGLAKAKQPAKQPAKRRASKVVSENVAEKEEHNSLTTNVVRESAHTDKSRGTRLPDDWLPRENPEATERHAPGIDVRRELDKFRDYWRAIPGTKGRKTDWDATWRNWLRRAVEQNGSRPQARAPAGNGHDDKVNGYLAFANPQRPELEA